MTGPAQRRRQLVAATATEIAELRTPQPDNPSRPFLPLRAEHPDCTVAMADKENSPPLASIPPASKSQSAPLLRKPVKTLLQGHESMSVRPNRNALKSLDTNVPSHKKPEHVSPGLVIPEEPLDYPPHVSALIAKHHLQDLEHGPDALSDIWKQAESRGLLTMDMVLDFASHLPIVSLNLSPSFAHQSPWRYSEIQDHEVLPLLSISDSKNVTAVEITRPFFQRSLVFSSLRMLDLTGIPLDDESMRYLIKLEHIEALGLSGTRVTSAGLKYLARYAAFKDVLVCLKLCYLEQLYNDCISCLALFVSLKELDLLGSDQITLDGLIGLLETRCATPDGALSFSSKIPLRTLRVPQPVYARLIFLHTSYQSIQSQTLLPSFRLVNQPGLVRDMSRAELMEQLKVHRAYYPNVYLNLPKEDLEEKLYSILVSRLKEERLWSLL